MLIETLKMFCDVSDLKSFSRAAEANAVSQSSASQQVRQLEKHWKVTLLERRHQNVTLTPAGQHLYREARIILEHYDNIHRHLGKSAHAVGGTIRVATIYSIGLHELQPYIRDFMKSFPQVKIRVDYKANAKIYSEVSGQRVDLGIVSYPAPRPTLEILPFRNDRLVVVCAPGHAFAGKKSVPLAQLNGQSFIGFDEEIPTRKAIDQALRERNVSVKMALEFDNIETLKRAVEIGSGISILPHETVKNEIQHRTLEAVEIRDVPLHRPLGILVKKGRILPAAVSKFLKVLTESDEPGGDGHD